MKRAFIQVRWDRFFIITLLASAALLGIHSSYMLRSASAHQGETVLSDTELAQIFGADCTCTFEAGTCTNCGPQGCDVCRSCTTSNCENPVADTVWKCSGTTFYTCGGDPGVNTGKECVDLGVKLCKTRHNCTCAPPQEQKTCGGGSCVNGSTFQACKTCTGGTAFETDSQGNYTCRACGS
jgi:hypothetical protein